jgi:hypothetical protein
MLRGHESEVAHELASSGEAGDVPDLADQANGADGVDAAQRPQGGHHRLEAPALDRLLQRSG